MVSSLSLLACEASVSVKRKSYRKKYIIRERVVVAVRIDKVRQSESCKGCVIKKSEKMTCPD